MSWRGLLWRGLAQRRLSSLLTLSSVALGVMLVTAILIVQAETERHFSAPGTGHGLVVGAPGSRLQLVLNAIYHRDQSPGLLSYQRYEELRKHPSVRLAVPYAVGDSFRGYRVVGTTDAFFQPIFPQPKADTPGAKLQSGRPFHFSEEALREALSELTANAEDEHDDHAEHDEEVYEAVVGSHVATELGVRVGDRIEPTHGVEGAKAHEHEQLWTVVGILKPTDTPIDRIVLINLDSFYRIPDHSGGVIADTGDAGLSAVLVFPRGGAHKALLLGQLSKRSDLMVADVDQELRELRSLVGRIDQLLLLVAGLVVLVALLGILVALYNSMASRRREVAILRSLGARRVQVLTLLVGEAGLLGLAGAVLGWLGGRLLVLASAGIIEEAAGFRPDWASGTTLELALLAAVAFASLLAGLLPGLEAYRTDVAKHLAPPS